jgi:hypothetical protein
MDQACSGSEQLVTCALVVTEQHMQSLPYLSRGFAFYNLAYDGNRSSVTLICKLIEPANQGNLLS